MVKNISHAYYVKMSTVSFGQNIPYRKQKEPYLLAKFSLFLVFLRIVLFLQSGQLMVFCRSQSQLSQQMFIFVNGHVIHGKQFISKEN